MKILIVSALYPPHVIGGAEKAASLLAEALVQQGYQVAVASLHPGSSEVVENRNGVVVYRLPMDNFYWPFGRSRKLNALCRLAWHVRDAWNCSAARRVGRIMDIESPDIVHTHCIAGFSLSVWWEAKRRKIRLVHTLHDYYLLCSRSKLFQKGTNCTRRCLECKVLTAGRRRLSRLPDSVVSVSQHTLDEHLRRRCFEGVPTEVICNIHNLAKRASVRTMKAESESTDLIFGFIGKLEEAKGIETLLEATRRIEQQNWKLKIAGAGLDNYVKQLSDRYTDPRIEWLGFTDSASFYSSVEVVVIPSLWAEPLPYVCVEALHAGKTLLCASSGGIPEIARLSEIVEFFPAGDADSLAETMNKALMSPGRFRECRIGDASKLDVFKEENVLERYLRVYSPPVPR